MDPRKTCVEVMTTEEPRKILVGEFVGYLDNCFMYGCHNFALHVKGTEGGIFFFLSSLSTDTNAESIRKDYNLEVLREGIMSVIDSGEIVVIYAGYCKRMKRIIASSEGFGRW